MTLKTSILWILALGLFPSGESWGGLASCKFNFGMSWKGNNAIYPKELDYVTLWAGSDESFNIYWTGAMLNACKPGGKLDGRTPVFYSYIIAFTARRDLGLKDCNVGSPNLCEKGANYMRQRKSRILSQYQKYASETAKIWGTQKPIIWMMEPDYYQYASGAKQQGGPLSYQEAGAYMAEIVATVRRYLPNAVFSMDISPWTPNPSAWFGAFRMRDFTYMNTSGGQTEAADIRIRRYNSMTWKTVHTLTGKGIIADDGYGTAGSSTGHDAAWDNPTNLKARIGDGVIAITQANPKTDWNSTIVSIRSQIKYLATCSTPQVTAASVNPSTLEAQALQGRDILGRF